MEAIVLCGIQGAGKSTFVRERLFDTHVRISRDLLRTPHREARFLELCLENTYKRLEIPSLEEGFAEVWRVEEGVPRWLLGAADR